MVNIFLTIIKFYHKWNILGFIMLSLYLQIKLLLLTPFRKRTGNPILIGLIWLAYVLADWVATFAIGLISTHQCYSPKPDDDRVGILALWAAFLLLHLGGPDNASALSIEDNSLWQRHLTGLISQFLSTIIVFSQTLPSKKLWICTFLVLVAGTIKNSERTYALYLGNLNRYRDSLIKRLPEPNYAEEATTLVKVFEFIPEKRKMLPNVEVVKYAHDFLEIFKGLVTGVEPKSTAREKSQKFFLENDFIEAFRVLEVELNLIYDVFYTKFFVVYSERGCVFRYIYWCVVVVALLIFSSVDKHGFLSIDVHLTYTLLFGAIGLDAIALFMFAISEWIVIHIDEFKDPNNEGTHIAENKDPNKEGSWRHSLCKCFLSLLEYIFWLKSIKWASEKSKTCDFDWDRKLLFGFFYRVKEILFSRWSRSLHTYNLIDYCLKERHKVNCKGVGFLKAFYDSIKYVSKEPVEEKLWKFIFTQLKEKAKYRKLGQHSSVASSSCTYSNLNKEKKMLSSSDFGDDYHQIILILHIATDLCNEKYKDNKSFIVDRENSKVLSDYMLYLLVMKPTLVSAVSGIVKVRLRDTCGVAKECFKNILKTKSQKRERERVCEECLEPNAMRESSSGDKKSQHVLREAFTLVKKLEELCPSKRWKLISELWVDLLAHAATHCEADMHIAQLNKGGELITFVWLLMAHFDLRDDFQSYRGVANILHKHMNQCSIIKS